MNSLPRFVLAHPQIGFDPQRMSRASAKELMTIEFSRSPGGAWLRRTTATSASWWIHTNPSAVRTGRAHHRGEGGAVAFIHSAAAGRASCRRQEYAQRGKSVAQDERNACASCVGAAQLQPCSRGIWSSSTVLVVEEHHSWLLIQRFRPGLPASRYDATSGTIDAHEDVSESGASRSSLQSRSDRQWRSQTGDPRSRARFDR